VSTSDAHVTYKLSVRVEEGTALNTPPEKCPAAVAGVDIVVKVIILRQTMADGTDLGALLSTVLGVFGLVCTGASFHHVSLQSKWVVIENGFVLNGYMGCITLALNTVL
jgi:hypothetical protein